MSEEAVAARVTYEDIFSDNFIGPCKFPAMVKAILSTTTDTVSYRFEHGGREFTASQNLEDVDRPLEVGYWYELVMDLTVDDDRSNIIICLATPLNNFEFKPYESLLKFMKADKKFFSADEPGLYGR